MKPDLRADYKIRLYTGPQNPFFEVSSFIQNELSYSVYKKRRKSTVQHRHLRIGILTQSLKNYSNRRMIEAAEACGHTIETIYTSRCYMSINAISPKCITGAQTFGSV